MSARSKARKRALDVLYAAEARGLDPSAVLAERTAGSGATGGDEPGIPSGTIGADDYAGTLVRGFLEHREHIDQLISQHSQGWALERMPAVDRAILRIAVYELVHGDGVPPAVAVDEAVEMAKLLSTDDSPRFVNGVLGHLVTIAPQLRGA